MVSEATSKATVNVVPELDHDALAAITAEITGAVEAAIRAGVMNALQLLTGGV